MIATHNPGKLAEMRELLAPHGVAAVAAGELGLAEPEETGDSFRANARIKAVAAASPVPLVVYNIPYRTGRALGSAALLELAATDNIVGLKQSVGALDVDTLTVLREFIRRAGPAKPRTSMRR